MAVRYYTYGALTNSPVQDVVWSGSIFQIEHHGGPIGMWNHGVGIISDNGDSVGCYRSYAGPLSRPISMGMDCLTGSNSTGYRMVPEMFTSPIIRILILIMTV
jgi:hypothetical protein